MFKHMAPSVRATLNENMHQATERFGLSNLMIQSFILQADQKLQVSAQDMAYSVSALLESPKSLTPGMENHHETNLGQNRVISMENTNRTLEAAHSCQFENFWQAYKSLDKVNSKMLEQGIELAKTMQKSIVDIGTSLIEKKEIKIANGFRYVILENNYLKDQHIFQYPLAL